MIYAVILVAILVFWPGLLKALAKPNRLRAPDVDDPQPADFAQYSDETEIWSEVGEDDAPDDTYPVANHGEPTPAATLQPANITAHAANMAAITRSIYGPGLCSPR